MPLARSHFTKPPRGTPLLSGHSLLSGLQGFYALSEGSGPRLVDSSGVGPTLAGYGFGSASPWAGSSNVSLTTSLAGFSGAISAAQHYDWPITIAGSIRPVGTPSASSARIFGLSANNTFISPFDALNLGFASSSSVLLYNTSGGGGKSTSYTPPAGVHTVVALDVDATGKANLHAGGGLVFASVGTETSPAYSATSQAFVGNPPATTGTRTANIWVSWWAWWNRVLSPAEHLELARNPWQIFRTPRAVRSSPAATSLAAGTGSFSGVGGTSTSRVGLAAASGASSASGGAASSSVALGAAGGPFAESGGGASAGFGLGAGTGSSAAVGGSATLAAGAVLEVDPGSFAEAGGDASFGSGLAASAGPFATVGGSATLAAGERLDAAGGASALAGGDASFGHGLPASAGPFATVGGSATLAAGDSLSAGGGALASSGGDASFSPRLAAAMGVFAAPGGAATLRVNYPLAAGGGDYDLAGGDASSSPRIAAATGPLALAGGTSTFRVGLASTGGTFGLAGGDLDFDVEGPRFDVDGAVLALSGGGAMLKASGTAAPQLFRQALRSRLLAIGAVNEIAGGHVFPGVVPQQHDLDRDGPAITYTVTVTRGMGKLSELGHHLRGSDGTAAVRVQVSAWSYDFGQADAISEALFAALDGLWGVAWGDGLEIMSCIREQQVDLPEAPTTDRPRAIYQIANQFHIRYRTAAAVRT